MTPLTTAEQEPRSIGPPTQEHWSATRRTVAVLGVLAALVGIEHAVGEIVQGRGAPPGLVFPSWLPGTAFDPLNGEPAMSLIPDLLASGIFTVAVALLLGVWSVGSAHRRHGGLVLIALSVLLLLVGGGFGPPLVGVVAGLLATRIGSPRPSNIRGATRFATRLWPWALVLATGCFLGLVPGVPLLYSTIGVTDALVGLLTVGAFGCTALAAWSARARDTITARTTPTGPRR